MTLTKRERATMAVAATKALDSAPWPEAVAVLEIFAATQVQRKPPAPLSHTEYLYKLVIELSDEDLSELHGHLCIRSDASPPQTSADQGPVLPDSLLLRTQQNRLLEDVEAAGFLRSDFSWDLWDTGNGVDYFGLCFEPHPGYLFEIAAADESRRSRDIVRYSVRATPGVSAVCDEDTVGGFDALRDWFRTWLQSVRRESVPNRWTGEEYPWLRQDTSDRQLTLTEQRHISQGLNSLAELIEREGEVTTAALADVRRDIDEIKARLPTATARSVSHAVAAAVFKWFIEGLANQFLLAKLLHAAQAVFVLAGLVEQGPLPLPSGEDI